MKKISFLGLIAGLLLFAIPTVHAQIGIKAGATMSSLSQDAFYNNGQTLQDIEDKSLWGFQAGLFANLPVGEVISIQPEINWMQKGGNTKYNIAGSGFNQDYRLNYLEVPVLLKVNAGSNDGTGVGLFFYGGPFVSYALNGKISSEIKLLDNTVENNDTDINFSDDNQRRVDWGAAFGLGVNLGGLMVDLRYDLGINNLLDNNFGTNPDEDPYLRTRSIGLTLGYMFGGGNY